MAHAKIEATTQSGNRGGPVLNVPGPLTDYRDVTLRGAKSSPFHASTLSLWDSFSTLIRSIEFAFVMRFLASVAPSLDIESATLQCASRALPGLSQESDDCFCVTG